MRRMPGVLEARSEENGQVNRQRVGKRLAEIETERTVRDSHADIRSPFAQRLNPVRWHATRRVTDGLYCATIVVVLTIFQFRYVEKKVQY